MKRFIIVAAVAFSAVASFVANAQSHKDLIPGAVASRPANANGTKMLTMEETFLSRELSPQLARFKWVETEEGFEPVEVKAEGRGMGRGGPRDRESVPEGAAWSCFTRDNGLYLRYADGTVTALAEDEDGNIVYGQTVSRNEFGIEDGIFIAPDSSRIAFYRKDESRVTSFPLLDISTRTGSLREIKYPMAGMDSEVLRLCVYDFASRDTLHLKVSDFGADRYLTNVTWSPDSRYVFVQVLDRSQRHCRLNVYEASTGDFVQTVLTEDNEKYVEPLDPLYFLEGSDERFVYRTANRDGYRSLYLCDFEGVISRLTVCGADVDYVGNDGSWVYYMSAEVSPIESHLFRVNVESGETVRLTEGEGWHYVDFSPDYQCFMDVYSSLCNPGTVELRRASGELVRVLDAADDPTEDYAYGEVVLGKVRSANGLWDNYFRVVLPADFDPCRKYPMIVYVYGGPHSQMVTDSFLGQLRRWEMYMAQRGYVLYIQDNRGTSNRGLEYEQAIYGRCGQEEMADQMVGVNMMMGLDFIDSERVGVHGWSYGGFMTISLATNFPDVFKVAVAGGPVIDWKWYEVMYGERYMGRPEENVDGYGVTSLINMAGRLRGRLLICQGAVDNTVVWEHSLSFVQKCIDEGVQVDYFAYPRAEHNMFGRERVHLHYKISEYFDLFL